VDLKSLSLPQRLLAGAGCIVVLLLIALVAIFIWWERAASAAVERDLRGAPAGWTDSLRIAGRVPDPGDLARPRTDSGDGAWVVYDTARAFQLAGIQHAYRARVGTETATAADSAIWAALAADTALDRWAAAAGTRDWDATTRLLAMRPGARTNVVLMPVPSYVPARDAARALVIRGLGRLQRGDRAGARADLAAATGLGFQLVRHEPTFIGLLVGHAIAASGATGWQRFAQATRDTALAAQADRLRAWAALRPAGTTGLLAAAPDSAVAIARDTSLALGIRVFALEQVLAGWFVRPRGLVFGPPARVMRTLESFTADPDPDMRRMAEVTLGTARRLNLFGLQGLTRETR